MTSVTRNFLGQKKFGIDYGPVTGAYFNPQVSRT